MPLAYREIEPDGNLFGSKLHPIYTEHPFWADEDPLDLRYIVVKTIANDIGAVVFSVPKEEGESGIDENGNETFATDLRDDQVVGYIPAGFSHVESIVKEDERKVIVIQHIMRDGSVQSLS